MSPTAAEPPGARARAFRTALVSMPWGAVDRPALGISLLKSGLTARGLACEILYLNVPFAAQLGIATYNWVQSSLPHVVFAGDWAFTEALYGPRPDSDRRYLDEHLGGKWGVSAADRGRLEQVRNATGPFLDWCMAAIDWEAYDAVGFTSTFEQNIASLALAQRLKARWPELVILFGGANWEGEMGRELHARFPFVDIACSGEADETLPLLVTALAEGAPPAAVAAIPGLVVRDAAGASVATGAPRPVTAMDALPIPDYADYFAALDASGAAAEVVPTLLLETSRGCWWGAKSHCTFCGLNGQGMAYRSKTGARALAELKELVGKWPTGFVSVVDNILDMKYFKTFFPALIEADLNVGLFWEVKANLSREQVASLARAGVTRIQPGIESLSTRLLGMMRKGTTALRNVQLLKRCRENGVMVDWNHLYGVPGEQAEDYAAVRALLPAIAFLPAPSAYGAIRLDRFSPYHHDPAAYGLHRVRPVPAYAALYPFDDASLARIAYYFDFEQPESDGGAIDLDGFIGEVATWMRDPDPGALNAFDDGAELRLIDTRRGAPARTVRLSGPARTAYRLCDEITSAAAVAEAVERAHPEERLGARAVNALLDHMTSARWMIADGDLYLSLATVPPAVSAAAGLGKNMSWERAERL
ncbi:MAG: hypothetical protein QOG13_1863 [Sphingomonadales bacterium]|jgi:ribosomal peptide maturation radical SAM protein 1|nr:hypothetical protein [Sphingomonadales bacterium]